MLIKSSHVTSCFTIVLACIIVTVHSYAVSIRDVDKSGDLRIEPSEAIVFPGDNVTFTCFHRYNSTFIWDFTSMIQSFDVIEGSTLDDRGDVIFYSKLSIYLSTRLMSGEISCSVDDGRSKMFAFLIINGVRNGGACQTSSDCITDKATCQDGICECPRNHVRLRVKERGYDVCREMIYSLYDPCEYDEQCAHLVDPRSICKSVCVCAPWARDKKGRCVSISEIAYNRSQEMYRVGLIAVTCIIILIVGVSLWVTLKRSCRDDHSDGQRRSITQADFNFTHGFSTEIPSDKPPSYDDVLENQEDTLGNPPNFKDALKHCTSAKKLIRQVSAPAGQLLPAPEKMEVKTFNEA